MEDHSLIVNLVATIVLAFFLGAIAQRFPPPLVGYLLAGVAVGPFTPDSSATPNWPFSSPKSA